MLSRIKGVVILTLFQRKWRKENKHNESIAKNIFPTDIVQVGDYTYGSLNIHCFGNPEEKLKIGSLCSIADNVDFLLGGGHNYTGFLTFPTKVKFMHEEVEAETKGPIIVDDDVWIGSHSMILSGVHIGQGAVIGAGSIVTKNVPPYAIVVGNPARIIKYRFDDQIINELGDLDYSKLNKDKLKKIAPLLYGTLTVDIIRKIKDAIR